MAEKRIPALLRGVSRLDSVVAPVLKDAVQSEAAGLVIAVTVRVRRGLTERFERASRHALHAANLPAGSDVRRLLAQVALVEREVRDLAKTLEDGKATGRDEGEAGAR